MHEDVARIVLDAIKHVNIDNIESRCVQKSFDTCGVNPWCSNLEAFEDHLASLSENKIYKVHLDNNNKNDIDWCLVDADEIRTISKQLHT